MVNKKQWDRMIAGKLYHPYSVGVNTFEKVHIAQKKFNESEYWHDKAVQCNLELDNVEKG